MDSTERVVNLKVLLQNAERLMADKHYRIALVPLRKILHHDPQNWTARHYFIRCCLCEGGIGVMREAGEELSLILLNRAGK